MASSFTLLLYSFTAIFILLQSHVIAAQQLKTVLAGEAVEFSCSLSESLPPGDVSWKIQWGHDSRSSVIIDAEATSPVYDPVFNTGHGEFRTVYRSERGIRFTHYCTLIIENVQLNDAGEYSCKHVGNFRDRGIFSEYELRVLPRPPEGDLPRCSQSVITSSSSPQNNLIELACHFSGGNPPATLVWYKEGLSIGQFRENSNIMDYQLQPSDNGVEFSCHAMSPALSETSYCHLTPLEIYPTATLSPPRVEATQGADVTFTCSGEGVPSIDRIDWYVDGVLQGDSSRGVVQSNNLKVANASDLTLYDLRESENGMGVMCEVSVASGLSADSLARITMLTSDGPTVAGKDVTQLPTNRHTATRTNNQDTKASKTGASTATLAKTDSTKSPGKIFTKPASGQRSPFGMTTHKYRRVAIPDGKSDNSKQQDPSQKTQPSKASIPGTIIGFICLFVIVVIIVIVVKKRRQKAQENGDERPDSPTHSLPVANNPMAINEFENNMYEGTIYNTSERKASENFYQAAPFDEDPGKTWSTYEGCGIWQDSSNVPHYENTAIGCPIPTFARQNNNVKDVDASEEKERMLQDIDETEGGT